MWIVPNAKKCQEFAYSVTIISCQDLAEIYDKLFLGFFSAKQSKVKNNKEYRDYWKNKDKNS